MDGDDIAARPARVGQCVRCHPAVVGVDGETLVGSELEWGYVDPVGFPFGFDGESYVVVHEFAVAILPSAYVEGSHACAVLEDELAHCLVAEERADAS